MAGREPEHVAHGLALARRRLRERRWTRRFLPGSPGVGAAQYRRTEVARLHCGEQRAAIARIEDRVMHRLAEKVGAVDRPVAAPFVRRKDEEALAGADEDEKPRHGAPPPVEG